MATKKGLLEQAKDAIVGVFETKPTRNSPKRVAAGEKAARTRKVNDAVKEVKKTARKAVRTTAKTAKTAASAVRKVARKALPDRGRRQVGRPDLGSSAEEDVPCPKARSTRS